MKRFAEGLLVRIMLLEVRLRSACERLAAGDDAEALHDLRIVLRTLRSLLRPLRGVPGIDVLEQAAADVGHLSNPLRESQVMVGELQRLGLSEVAASYAGTVDGTGRSLLTSVALQRLLVVLDGFPPIWRLAIREGCTAGLRRRIRRSLSRGVRKLPVAAESVEDLHALRLRVKHLRYVSEAYPQLSPLRRRELKLLRQLQQVLGDWNDCQHWLACSSADQRLAHYRTIWQARAEACVPRALELLTQFMSRAGSE